MKRALLPVLLAASIAAMAGDIDQEKLDALSASLRFSAKQSVVKEELQNLGDVARLRSALGTNNLSTFYLAYPSYGCSWQQLKNCEWHDEAGVPPPMNEKLQKRLRKGQSLFLPEDVRDISWNALGPNTADGSFRIETDWKFRAKCLFKASKQNGKWQVTALAVAKSGSSEFPAGFVVFDTQKSK